MSVLCSGQTGVLEQLGEKQDFEAELSRRGYRHEEFTLHVEPAKGTRLRGGWNPRYEVKVTHTPTQTVRAYQGGPRLDWVPRFVKDLAAGLYGEPSVPRAPSSLALRRHTRA